MLILGRKLVPLTFVNRHLVPKTCRKFYPPDFSMGRIEAKATIYHHCMSTKKIITFRFLDHCNANQHGSSPKKGLMTTIDKIVPKNILTRKEKVAAKFQKTFVSWTISGKYCLDASDDNAFSSLPEKSSFLRRIQ